MITRDVNGKLKINTVKLQLLFGDILDVCESHSELEFVADNLQGYLEKCIDERYEEIENEYT